MQPLILVFEDVDVRAFRSAADAERFMEPIDVHNGIYAVFDSLGRRLTPRVDQPPGRWKWLDAVCPPPERVTLIESEDAGLNQHDVEEVIGRLKRFWTACGRPEQELTGMSLEQLVGKLELER